MEENNLSKIAEKVFQSELIVNYIFDYLKMEDKLNFSLCNKKINSFFNQRPKFLNTNIHFPHSNCLQEIEIPLLNKISCKYKNIKKIETSFGSDNKLKIISDLNFASTLEILEISCITSNIDSIGKFTNLKQLYLYWNYNQDEATNLSFLGNLPNLEILKLNRGIIVDIDPIKKLTKLKELSISKMTIGNVDKNGINDYYDYSYSFSKPKQLDITPISSLLNLEKLDIYNSINSIKPIKQLINLKELELNINSSISDISILSNLINLRKLNLGGSEIKNIDPIKYLVNLEQLDLYGMYKIEDFSTLSYLINLKVLDISNTHFTDLNIIKGLIKMENLNLSKNKDLIDISPLSSLINLKKLNLDETKVNNIKAIETLIKLEELKLDKGFDYSGRKRERL